MKRLPFCAALLALSLPAFGAGSADGRLTATDREQVVQLLEEGRDRLLAAVAALDDAGWSYKPSPDRWSAAEIVEHLYKAEGLFQSSFEQALGIVSPK